jgi:hypothetical protein
VLLSPATNGFKTRDLRSALHDEEQRMAWVVAWTPQTVMVTSTINVSVSVRPDRGLKRDGGAKLMERPALELGTTIFRQMSAALEQSRKRVQIVLFLAPPIET